jgi:hypothetical protein
MKVNSSDGLGSAINPYGDGCVAKKIRARGPDHDAVTATYLRNTEDFISRPLLM